MQMTHGLVKLIDLNRKIKKSLIISDEDIDALLKLTDLQKSNCNCTSPLNDIRISVFKKLYNDGDKSNDLIDQLSNKIDMINKKNEFVIQNQNNNNTYDNSANDNSVCDYIMDNNDGHVDANMNIPIHIIDLPDALLGKIATFLSAQEILTSFIHLSYLFLKIGLSSSSLHYWQFNYNNHTNRLQSKKYMYRSIPKFKFDSILSNLKLLHYSDDFSSIFNIFKTKMPEQFVLGMYL